MCFALSAGDVTSRQFELNGQQIELKPGECGLPTIRDLDVLIYCAQLHNGGIPIDTTNQQFDFRFSAQDFLKYCGRGIGGAQVQGFFQALDRFGSSEISVRDPASTGAESTEQCCKLLSYTTELNSDNSDDKVSMSFSGKLFCVMPSRMTRFIFAEAMHPDYFKLKPLQRSLYWLAVINCDIVNSYTLSIEQLHRLTGASSPLRNFRVAIQEVTEHPLLNYRLSDVELALIPIRREASFIAKAIGQINRIAA